MADNMVKFRYDNINFNNSKYKIGDINKYFPNMKR